MRLSFEGMGYCPFATDACFRWPIANAGRYPHKVPRSSSSHVIGRSCRAIDVTDVVADGRREIPRARLRSIGGDRIELANDFVGIEGARNHRCPLSVFYCALP